MSTLPVTARRNRPARSVFAFRGSVLGLQLLALACTLLPFALYPLLGCTATIPLLLAYNGSRGRPMKWLAP